MADEPTTAAADVAPLSLIYLDVDDEITSAASRIRAAGAEDVALVLPFGSRLATSRINFRLLAREAAARGKRLEIITADASARSLAAAAGLPIHASVAAFEAHRSGDPNGSGGAGAAAAEGAASDRAAAPAPGRDGTTAPRADAANVTGRAVTGTLAAAGAATGVSTGEQLPLPSPDLDDAQTRVLPVPRRATPRVPLVGPARPPIRTGIAVGVGLAVVVTVIAAGLLALEFLPSATITLNPRSAPIGPIELSVEAREDVTAPDAAALRIPAQRFTFPLEVTQTFPSTGVKVTETKATGNVTFSNNDTGRVNTIPAGAIVATESGVEFETLAEVTLPPAFLFPFFPSTASVGVQAVEPGTVGNVDAETITVTPRGENRRLLQVINREPTSGGERSEAPEVSEDDVEAAKTALQAALIAALDEQVAGRVGVPAEVTLFESTRAAGEPAWSVDPATLVGTAAAEFSLGATAQGSALGVDPAPIDAIAQARLRERVTNGWSLQPGSIAVDVGTPSDLAGTILYPVIVAGTQVHDVDEGALLAEIRGLRLPEARSRLDDYGDVAIEVWPDWVTTIPTRAERVTLTLGEPQPSAPPS